MKKLFICVVIFASSLYSCQNEQSTLDELGQTGKKSNTMSEQVKTDILSDLFPEDPEGGGQGGPPNTPIPDPSALPWILIGKHNGHFSKSIGSQYDVYNTVTFAYNLNPITPHPDPVGLKLRLAVVHEMPGNFAYWIRSYVMNIKNGVPIFLQDFPVTVNAISTNGYMSGFPGTANGVMTINSCSINATGNLDFNCTVKWNGNTLNINKVNMLRAN
jgi:hypothetical protein